MGLPITKTVKLVWDGVDWRDNETGNIITGVNKIPYNHPFDKSKDVSMGLVEQMISKVIESQRLDTQESFGVQPPAESLVSYRYLREMVNIISSEINRLERRVIRLEGDDV